MKKNEKTTSMLENGMFAHVDYKTKRCQSMKEHAENVAQFSEDICEIEELKNIVRLAGILHDAGKLSIVNQNDFKKILKIGDKAHKKRLDHSTAGGRLICELDKNDLMSEFISTLIYFHHGVEDCINLDTGQGLQKKRLDKDIDYEHIKEAFVEVCDNIMLKKHAEDAKESYEVIIQKISNFIISHDPSCKKCGSRYFYLGLYLRVALSLLIDGDWTDTECFFEKNSLPNRMSKYENEKIWNKCIDNFEKYLHNEIQKNPLNGNRLNTFRQEISELCKETAEKDHTLYRLTVPTGSGKTLSSLRFALNHAQKKEKCRIFYIAPYNSILEQNAEEIRKAIGIPSFVLEHHCNVVCEEGEEEKYRNLIETWDSPIIVTTAVQILNTLYSSQKSSIRRMHTLCNSIIIFDEVQAIPAKCTELFNLAVNFLSRFCDTTVVLCSATQPTLASMEENNICECHEMIKESKKYTEDFKRVKIIDDTACYPDGMKIEDLAHYVTKKTDEFDSTLVIVNTTACASKAFNELESCCDDGYELFHLSNNMCAKHKLDTLNQIRTSLKLKFKKIICVSTQVVEAGVDFSFGCVIRSKAGLDNVIQAAGRCNRHKELEGERKVYIVQMSKEAENLEYLQEIRKAQIGLQKVLDNVRHGCFELESEEAIKIYFSEYFSQLGKNETKFPITVGGVKTTIVDLLGRNELGKKQYCRNYKTNCKLRLRQAFKTAGSAFEVISNDYKVGVVVPYDTEAKNLLQKFNQSNSDIDKEKILRALQRYTVSVSEEKIMDENKLKNIVYEIQNGIFVLRDGYYDKKVGVVNEPKMGFYEI